MDRTLKIILLDNIWALAQRIQDTWEMILKGKNKRALKHLRYARRTLSQILDEVEKEVEKRKDAQRQTVATL